MIKKILSLFKVYSKAGNVLIYQMGKVGSTSYEKALKGSIHTHSLYNNNPCQFKVDFLNHSVYLKFKILLLTVLRRFAIRRREKIKIISFVREPFSRNISMFFQNLPYWQVKYDQISKENKAISKGDTRSEGGGVLINTFDFAFDHDYCSSWFDKEIKRFTGIDVYQVGFSKNDGYQLYTRGKYELLIISFDRLNDQNIINVVEDFTGQEIEINHTNKGSSKWYHSAYSSFKKNYIFRDEMIKRLCDTPYFKTFFEGKSDYLSKKEGNDN